MIKHSVFFSALYSVLCFASIVNSIVCEHPFCFFAKVVRHPFGTGQLCARPVLSLKRASESVVRSTRPRAERLAPNFLTPNRSIPPLKKESHGISPRVALDWRVPTQTFGGEKGDCGTRGALRFLRFPQDIEGNDCGCLGDPLAIWTVLNCPVAKG